jgi:hypothetical protein
LEGFAALVKAEHFEAIRLSSSRNFLISCGIGNEIPAAGNGIFGCRDRAPKIGFEDRQSPQRQKARSKTLVGFRGLEELGGGDDLDQTGYSPAGHRTGL